MRIVKTLLACCIAVLFLSACGKISVKGTDGTVYNSYQECCAAQDFQAAHQYLAKMQNDKDFKDDYDSAKEFVFKQEALFLMSQGDDNAKMRILYLIKEEGGSDDYIDMIIDLAIMNDDDKFVMSLLDCKKGTNKTTTEQNAVKYLAGFKDEEHVNYIIKSLSNVTIAGRAMSKGLHRYTEGNRRDIDYDEAPRIHFRYTDGIVDFNKKCENILDIAIASGNQYLAQKVLMCFKQNIETIAGGTDVKAPDGTRVDGFHSYVWYTNADKDKAQKKYDEAVKSGAFNRQ